MENLHRETILSIKVLLGGLLSVNRKGMQNLKGHGRTCQGCWKTGIKTVWNSSVPRGPLRKGIFGNAVQQQQPCLNDDHLDHGPLQGLKLLQRHCKLARVRSFHRGHRDSEKPSNSRKDRPSFTASPSSPWSFSRSIFWAGKEQTSATAHLYTRSETASKLLLKLVP